MIPTLVWNGFVLSKLWYWFMVPTFNCAPLGVVPAIGIQLIISLIVSKVDKNLSQDTLEQTVYQIASAFVIPLFFLIVGAFVSLFL